jgi:hypothetical protein
VSRPQSHYNREARSGQVGDERPGRDSGGGGAWRASAAGGAAQRWRGLFRSASLLARGLLPRVRERVEAGGLRPRVMPLREPAAPHGSERRGAGYGDRLRLPSTPLTLRSVSGRVTP